MLDPRIVEAMMQPVSQSTELSPSDEELLHMVAEGRTVKANTGPGAFGSLRRDLSQSLPQNEKR